MPTIDQLGSAAALTGTELIPIFQSVNPAVTTTPVAIKTFLGLTSSSQFGLVKVDGTTITASGGVISAAPAVSGANPSATAGPAAVNGSAATFMRSDGAPAVQLGTSSQKGIVQVDGTTVTVASGVISVANGVGSAIFWGVF